MVDDRTRTRSLLEPEPKLEKILVRELVGRSNETGDIDDGVLALPIVMPLGLIRNTRPLDWSWPSMAEGVVPVTRLRTALAPDCWRNRVIS
jgi:hypothetical protein